MDTNLPQKTQNEQLKAGEAVSNVDAIVRKLHVFPVRNKKPLTKKGLYDARPEDTWSGDESDSWAAPTGELNGFFIIDVDAQHGGIETARTIDWGDTLIVKTPSGGYHVYYKYDETVKDIRTGTNILPGIDIRNNGGYACLYSEVDPAKIRSIPAEVRELIQNKTKKSYATQVRKAEGEAQAEIAEGGRNAYLTKVAGRMQRIGVLTLAALQEKNEQDCNPPLEDEEVTLIFNSVSRYNPESTPDEDEVPQPKIVWATDMIAGMFEFLRDKGKTLGEPTGVKALDDLLGGGKRLGELTVTMAEAKTGKNTFWHYQQRTMLDRGVAIGYASRELSPETEVLPNLLTLKLAKNIYKAQVTEEEVIAAIADWKLAFAPGYGAFQGNQLFEWLDECIRHGVQYYFIDHLHYCLEDAEDFKLLSEFGRKLKTYCKTHQIHIDLIIQPKVRGMYKSGEKMVKQDMDIGMLRGGASLGQVLDSLITMDRLVDDEGNLMDYVKVDLKRARSKMAKTGTFYLKYDFSTMTFSECGDPREAPVRATAGSGLADNKKGVVHKDGLTKQGTPGYAESKNGEFFNLRRSVDKMLGSINDGKAE
jgi:hypothetical protein